MKRRFGPVSRGWAITILCAGFVVTVCAIALSLATADEWCLWAAIPANLGLSVLLFVLFQLRLAALVRNLRKHPKSTDAYMVSVGQLQQFLEFLSTQRQLFSLHSPRISHRRGKIFIVAMEYQR